MGSEHVDLKLVDINTGKQMCKIIKNEMMAPSGSCSELMNNC